MMPLERNFRHRGWDKKPQPAYSHLATCQWADLESTNCRKSLIRAKLWLSEQLQGTSEISMAPAAFFVFYLHWKFGGSWTRGNVTVLNPQSSSIQSKQPRCMEAQSSESHLSLQCAAPAHILTALTGNDESQHFN